MSGKRRACQVKELSPVDLAWVAGLLEGEGSFCIHTRPDRPTNYPLVFCSMTDRDVILKLQALTGVGTVISYQPPGGHKVQYRWRVAQHNNAFSLGQLLYPLMGERRKSQIDNMLSLDIS